MRVDATGSSYSQTGGPALCLAAGAGVAVAGAAAGSQGSKAALTTRMAAAPAATWMPLGTAAVTLC